MIATTVAVMKEVTELLLLHVRRRHVDAKSQELDVCTVPAKNGSQTSARTASACRPLPAMHPAARRTPAAKFEYILLQDPNAATMTTLMSHQF